MNFRVGFFVSDFSAPDFVFQLDLLRNSKKTLPQGNPPSRWIFGFSDFRNPPKKIVTSDFWIFGGKKIHRQNGFFEKLHFSDDFIQNHSKIHPKSTQNPPRNPRSNSQSIVEANNRMRKKSNEKFVRGGCESRNCCDRLELRHKYMQQKRQKQQQLQQQPQQLQGDFGNFFEKSQIAHSQSLGSPKTCDQGFHLSVTW